mmetsp:Transcript_10090/g.18164  ORF Transcript_10090/g.18164 Transcript_10090/m.18164 type:complete len:216 (+) Transcript_10090:1975-2622(+)
MRVVKEVTEKGPKRKKDVRRVRKAPLMAAPWIMLGGTFLAMVGFRRGESFFSMSTMDCSGGEGLDMTGLGGVTNVGWGGSGGGVGLMGGSEGGVGLMGHDFSSVSSPSSSSSSSLAAVKNSSSFSLVACNRERRNLVGWNEEGSIHCWVLLLLLDLLPNKPPLPAPLILRGCCCCRGRIDSAVLHDGDRATVATAMAEWNFVIVENTYLLLMALL